MTTIHTIRAARAGSPNCELRIMHCALFFALLLDLYTGEGVGLAAAENIDLTVVEDFARSIVT